MNVKKSSCHRAPHSTHTHTLKSAGCLAHTHAELRFELELKLELKLHWSVAINWKNSEKLHSTGAGKICSAENAGCDANSDAESAPRRQRTAAATMQVALVVVVVAAKKGRKAAAKPSEKAVAVAAAVTAATSRRSSSNHKSNNNNRNISSSNRQHQPQSLPQRSFVFVSHFPFSPLFAGFAFYPDLRDYAACASTPFLTWPVSLTFTNEYNYNNSNK